MSKEESEKERRIRLVGQALAEQAGQEAIGFDTAIRVIEALKEGATIGDLIDQIADSHGVERERFRGRIRNIFDEPF